MIYSDEQAKPIFSDCRLNLCLACPGSGKTFVTAERIKRLQSESSGKILAVTFSAKAAKELGKRIGNEKHRVNITTIHGFCFSIVKEYWAELGGMLGGVKWPSFPRVAEDRDELRLIRNLYPKDNSRNMFERFQILRKTGVEPEVVLSALHGGMYHPKITLEVARVWSDYEQVRISRGIITFDDMVRMAEALMPMPRVSNRICHQYQHVLIDEAQDTSHAQWRVLRPIVAQAATTLVVGDCNQSIYSFRQADGTVLKSVARLDGAVIFRLTKSYRSTGSIAKIANMVIKDPTSKINTEKQEGPPLVVVKYETHKDEVNGIIELITPGSAILARTNLYLEPFERELIKRGIPYSGQGFYKSEHIGDLSNCLKETIGDPTTTIEQAFIKNQEYSSFEREDFRRALDIIRIEGVEKFLAFSERQIEGEGNVVLSTGHAAKGLEYEKVFAVGVHKGSYPHKLAIDSEEERRLLYVVLTRAKDVLHISYVKDPSPFLPLSI